MEALENVPVISILRDTLQKETGRFIIFRHNTVLEEDEE